MNFLKSKKFLIGIILFIIAIGIISLFDKVLANGVILIAILSAITFFILAKTKTKSKMQWLFTNQVSILIPLPGREFGII